MIASLRNEYSKAALDIPHTEENPINQFRTWFEEARKAKVPEPSAMTLSTVDGKGKPSARIVLLKDITEHSLVFFTNYNSRKGKEIEENPFAALTFFWPDLERQVRVEGKLQKVDEQVSDAYFSSRPRASQIGAWASPQSEEVANRGILEIRERDYIEKFANKEVPRPQHWGGYELIPDQFEFWQGRRSRLHDRIIYLKEPNGWTRKRLAP